MFGDAPSDYCHHEGYRLKLNARDSQIACQCGRSWNIPLDTSISGNNMFLRYLQNQESRIKKLEQENSKFYHKVIVTG